MGADVAAECKHRRQVHLEYGVPIIIWKLVRWMALLNTATIEQDVDSMAICEDFWCELGDGFVRRKVRSIDCCFAAEFFDDLFCLLIGLVTLQIV